jgi:L-ascorbate metabolism protein UlaG (beta-lactamase superfamily)
MISAEGHTIYISGDTDVMADMQIFNDLHAPDIGILSAGGHFTMDMKRAGYAAAKFFDFETIIPCHYKTFPLLEQSADNLIKAVPNARVIEPELLVPIHI